VGVVLWEQLTHKINSQEEAAKINAQEMCVVVCCSVLQCVAVARWSVAYCVAVCCSVLLPRSAHKKGGQDQRPRNVCCRVLQCVAVARCRVAYCVAVCCSVLQRASAKSWQKEAAKINAQEMCVVVCCSVLQ